MSVYDTPRVINPYQDIDIEEFLRLRPHCEVGGNKCLGRASQRHHALYRRDHSKSAYRTGLAQQLDVAMNYQAVCENCHTGTGETDAKENRYKFYVLQCNRYGAEAVDGWIRSLPLKIKNFR